MNGPAPRSTADAETLTYYDAHAADYSDWSKASAESEALDRFLAALPAGGRILDLGCGAGWDSAAMLARGFAPRAVDASPGLVAQARAKGVPAEIGRFETFLRPQDRAAYDGAWVSFSLLHAPLAAWPAILRDLRLCLRTGGALFLGLKAGEGEHRDGLGRLYAYIEAAPLRGLLADSGFDVIHLDREASEGRDGARIEILLCHALAAGDPE